MYFAHPIGFFAFTNFEKKNTNLSGRLLFDVIPGLVLILIRTILEQSINNKIVSKV